ncbi:Oxidoreductase molybdopterin binding domain protein [Hartmannibacter diazotrophicus]|uniref:Oxidoreductase molybdopterin binding domain protein n=1 Tax=Hartmannibacter diazotrophicus TaxID=1482074 RepID=A0A2C9DDA1_9HYPH|nr:molybdopterin-dependent oxidoreductase [Hartmannibacter diazotrophicus]SON58223.1 Oxidoreductase molybdopterin binding domain protein [Hartmannibacter diazotrophicus]
MMRKTIAFRSTVLAAVLAFAPAAMAGSLPAPTGDVILTVTGKIENTNVDGTAQFDRAMLEALPGRHATMETPWTEGKVSFDGPLGRALMEAVGATGDNLNVVALNDYAAEVPMADVLDHDTIFATKMNGEEMSVRDKGPLFLIYPFDKEADLYNEKYFSRSVWQIKSIDVR